MNDVADAIARIRLVPVATVDDADDALPLAEALRQAGLPLVEITLRTPAGIGAVARLASRASGILVGAGSVTTAAAAAAAVDAGADFIVSPGLDESVLATAAQHGVLAIPGIATPTELMRAIDSGVSIVKLFPAEACGGCDMIRALSAVWPDMRFVPTGGITHTNAPDYLALPEVLAVGGAWLAPRSAIDSGDWEAISRAAVRSRILVDEAGSNAAAEQETKDGSSAAAGQKTKDGSSAAGQAAEAWSTAADGEAARETTRS